MTENKRFVSIDDGLDFSIKHIESGETFYDCDSVVNILNELAEENIILKSELSFSQNQNRELRKVLEDNRSMMEVVEENKQLKEENIAIKKTLHTIINQINVDKINNNKAVYSARILFKEKEFQFIYDIYKKSLEEL